ncbi:MAG: AEC family transporter [Chlorobi bacterium]|nr:AEC family transporter [Chlorobiota bacterium]
MELILFTVNIVSPVFLLIVVGAVLKKLKFIDDVFVSQSSKFVFNVSLPALIFLKISTVSIEKSFNGKLIAASLALVFVIAGISWFVSSALKTVPKDKGVFIQGSYRSNFAIVGLALIANLIGSGYLGTASLVLAFVMPLYNILAVVALTVPLNREKRLSVSHIIKDIATNPLILSAVVAAPFSIFHFEIGDALTKTLDYLGKISLPLALVGIGASLNFKSLKEASKLSFASSFLKIVLFPALAVLVGIFLGLDKESFTIYFILFASPTAIASFIMANAMGGNSKLAGDIIAITTLFSVLTLSAGIILLKAYGLI